MDIPTSPGSSGSDGTTLLYEAAGRGDTDCVKALIAAGADVNARDNPAPTERAFCGRRERMK